MASKLEVEFYLREHKYKINKSNILFAVKYKTTHNERDTEYIEEEYIEDIDKMNDINRKHYFPSSFPKYMYRLVDTYHLDIYLKGREKPINVSYVVTDDYSKEEIEKKLLEIENLLI